MGDSWIDRVLSNEPSDAQIIIICVPNFRKLTSLLFHFVGCLPGACNDLAHEIQPTQVHYE
jgi:hypothetical protein